MQSDNPNGSTSRSRLDRAIIWFTLPAAFVALVIYIALTSEPQAFLRSLVSIISLGTVVILILMWIVPRETKQKAHGFFPKHGLNKGVITITAVAIGVVSSWGLAYRAKRDIDQSADASFQKLSGRLETQIEDRMRSTLHGLESVGGLYAATKLVERGEFKAFASAIGIGKEFGYLQGLGFIERVPHAELDKFIAAERADEAPWFEVKNLGQEDPHYIIKFAEPMDRNIQVLGKDLGSIPLKRQAMEEALQTGQPTLSPPCELSVNGKSRRGFLYVLPIFKNGTVNDTVDQRTQNLVGFASARLITDELFHGITDDTGGLLDVELYDGPTISAKDIIFDADSGVDGIPDIHRFKSINRLRVGNRDWTLALIGTTRFAATISYSPALMTGVVGTILSVAISAGFWLLSNRRADAERVARTMTQSLQAQTGVLVAAENQMRSIVNNVPGMTYRCEGTDGWYLTFVSDAVETLTGYTAEEVRFNAKMPFTQIIYPDDLQMVNANADRAIESREPYEIEYRIVHKNGSVRWVRERGRPSYGADGQFKCLDGVIIDVTHAHQAQEALRVAKEAAETANRAKGQFLANMSHEIRTPMTAIMGFADILTGECDFLTRTDAVATIRRNCDHLLALINDILDLSKIDAGMLATNRTGVKPAVLAKEVISLLSLRAKERGIGLELSIDRSVPDEMFTDPLRFKQILTNLIGNAIKFTEKGIVAVRLHTIEKNDGMERLLVDIQDTGIGISAEDIDRLFSPFEQLDSTMTRRFGGTGLGLSISRKLARLLGGEIRVASTPRVGSTFTLSLPVVAVPRIQDMVESANIAKANAAPRSLEGVRILLAEDGKDNQRLLQFFLEKAGAKVTIVGDGIQAVAAMTIGNDLDSPLRDPCLFDILLLDLHMPEMDGFAVARKLRVRGCRVPLVAVTAQLMPETIKQLHNAGFNDLIPKPLDREQLLQVTRKWARPELVQLPDGATTTAG